MNRCQRNGWLKDPDLTGHNYVTSSSVNICNISS